MAEVLHLELRKKIYKILLLNPGLNLSRIAELLSISVPLADYHLLYMEENELITIVKEGGYKRYYIRGEIGVEEKKILSLLQQDIPLRIVLFLLKKLYSKPREIRNELNISPALLTYYLKKLKKYNIVIENQRDEKKEFTLVDEKQVVNLLIRYKPNILLKRFKDSWTVDFPLSSKVSDKKK